MKILELIFVNIGIHRIKRIHGGGEGDVNPGTSFVNIIHNFIGGGGDAYIHKSKTENPLLTFRIVFQGPIFKLLLSGLGVITNKESMIVRRNELLKVFLIINNDMRVKTLQGTERPAMLTEGYIANLTSKRHVDHGGNKLISLGRGKSVNSISITKDGGLTSRPNNGKSFFNLHIHHRGKGRPGLKDIGGADLVGMPRTKTITIAVRWRFRLKIHSKIIRGATHMEYYRINIPNIRE
jgi:hypothetical protein